jgi:ribosomal subunit interface protein
MPVHITFRNMARSNAVDYHVREKLSWLETFYDRIHAARVVIEVPHRHHRHGKVYQVRVNLAVPGGDVVVNREAGVDGAHADVYVAIRDAFDAAKRRLEEFARRRRGETKTHESAPPAPGGG